MSSTAAPDPGSSSSGTNSCAARERAARELAGVYPQERTVERLKRYLNSDTTNPGVLLEMAACTKRLRSNLDGVEAEVLQRLQDARPGDALGEEVAARYTVTTLAADRLLNRAAALDEYLEVHLALLGAEIDAQKADAFIDGTKTLPTAQARAIHRALLPGAPHLTVGQLRHRLRAAALAVDADLAQERHTEAVANRSVSLTPADDGMAYLTFYVSAPDAVAAMTTLDALAVKNGPGDDRPIGARRADEFMDLIHQAMVTGKTPDGSPVPTQQRKHPHLVITVAQSTLDGEDDAPGYLAGYGPLSAEIVRHLASDEREDCGVVPPDVTTSPDDDTTATCEAGDAQRADAVGSGAQPIAPGTRSVAPGTPTTVAPTDAFSGTLLPPPRAVNTPSGCSTADPFGLVSRLAKHADPVTALAALGILSSNAYQPGTALREHVLLRDVTCRFPTCRQPARRCQIDHIIPFDSARPAWAQTYAGNLHVLCQRHHQLKTAGLWNVHRDHAGDTHWSSPLGYRYIRPAEVVDPTHDLPALRLAVHAIMSEHADQPEVLNRPAPLDAAIVSPAELAEHLCTEPGHALPGRCTCAEQVDTVAAIEERLAARTPGQPRVSVLELLRAAAKRWADDTEAQKRAEARKPAEITGRSAEAETRESRQPGEPRDGVSSGTDPPPF